MKRFILSTISVLLATAAVAPTAQALPKLDPTFNLQTLRLSEFDSRNKSEEISQPYYSPTSTQVPAQNVTAEQDSIPTTESTGWESPKYEKKDASTTLSITERRHQSLDRS
ncbi:MAG: hypothetical protein HC800_18175 [Phormidesmis sp. RL_2_1]|nr:hypothetical protein [Phormidesmis sp. RL_2_1]